MLLPTSLFITVHLEDSVGQVSMRYTLNPWNDSHSAASFQYLNAALDVTRVVEVSLFHRYSTHPLAERVSAFVIVFSGMGCVAVTQCLLVTMHITSILGAISF